MRKLIPSSISSKVALAGLKLQQNSPTLLFAGGVVGVIGTAVLASRATLHLDEVLDDAIRSKQDLEEYQTTKPEQYSAEDLVKDKALLRLRTAGRVFKLYAPSLAVAAVSVAMLTGSHRILTRRNAALTAAYATIDKAFKQYRARVVDNYGEDVDRQFIHDGKVSKTVTFDADGKKKQTEKNVPTAVSPYGRLFHDGNNQWSPHPDYNLIFLRGIERMANDRLKSKGYVFLSELYDDLGFDQTEESRVVGWLADPEDGGDGYISLGIFEDTELLRVHEYLISDNGEIYLDFNVDGVILKKFQKASR